MSAPVANPISEPAPAVQGRKSPGAVMATAWVAGLFCLVVCGLLLLHHARNRIEDPLKSPRLTVLKERLQADPLDNAVKEEIRALDQELRRRYFRHLTRTSTGAWFLLVGLAVVIFAAKQSAAFHRSVPMPQPRPEAPLQALRQATWARWSVGVVGLVTVATFLTLGFGGRSKLPARWQDVLALATNGSSGAGAVAGAVKAGDWPSPEEMQTNWPRFRGPGGNGWVTSTNFPTSWDSKTGAGIAWKSPVPAAGFGSPVVWGGRVFLAGGDADKREVMCFDAQSGKLLWQQTVQGPPAPPGPIPEIPEMTGYAAATPATDGRRVYAIFANGDVAAFSVEGKPVWVKNLGFPQNPYGHAASLLTWQDRVLVQLDHGEAEKRQAKLYALAGATGEVLWQRPRAVPSSWATPIVISVTNQDQIITLADPWLTAYDAKEGNEIWKAQCLSGEVTPSPIFVSNLLFVVSPMDQLVALRPDGQGDVTKTHVLWAAHDNIPDITSPVSNGELVFLLDTAGLLTCFDAKGGEKVWEHELGEDCHASPTLAGDRLYLFTTKGTAVIAQAGRQYAELARNELGEPVSASPAFAHHCLFIRGQTNLFCIGAPAEKLAQ